MKESFREVYCKLFDDSYVRLRRCIKLRIKAIQICEEKDEQQSATAQSNGKNSSLNFEEVNQDNVNITH